MDHTQDTKPAHTTGLYYHLLGLVAATVLPILLVALVASWVTGKQIRLMASERLQGTATTLASAADQAFSQQASLLPLMTRAPLLHGDHSYLFQTNSPQAAALLPAGFLLRAKQSVHPQVSDLILLSDSKKPWVAISSGGPVGQPRTVLMRPSNDLLDLIPRRGDTTSGLVSLLDSQGRLAARSYGENQWLGTRVPDWEKLQDLQSDHGSFEATSQEGETILFTFQKLHYAPGWVLAVGEPISRIQAAGLTPFRGIIIGGVIATILALIIGQLLSARILRPVRYLTQRSRLIADGEEAPEMSGTSHVTEFEQLRRNLADAENALRQRAADARLLAEELERNQRRYRSVAEAGALVFWEANHRGQLVTCAGWQELTGQADTLALGNRWLRRVHPDDLRPLTSAWKSSIGHGGALDCEFRIRHQIGHWHWVRVRGAQIGQWESLQWAGVLEDVHTRRQAQDRIAWLASHDPLTGLANRNHFHEQLDLALNQQKNAQHVAVLCLDLDRFKEVNDTQGHPAGDALLQQVSERLTQQLRNNDVVARLGGDEFALLLVGNEIADTATRIAQRLVDEIGAPYRIDGCHVQIGASIGIAIASDSAITRERLMQHADWALYAAKAQGRGNYRFFDPSMAHSPPSR